jgi:hypothetical protein
MWTADEWSQYDAYVKTLPKVGLPFTIILLVAWFYDNKRYSNTLLMVFALLICLSTLFWVVLVTDDLDDMRCRDNTTRITDKDGISACAVQGASLIYFLLAAVFAWMFQSYDLFLQIVLNYKKENYSPYYKYGRYGLIFVYPLIPVLVFATGGYFGYYGTGPWCLTKDSETIPDGWYVIPISFGFLTGSISLLVVGCKYLHAKFQKTPESEESSNIVISKCSENRFEICFVFLFSIIWFSSFLYNIKYSEMKPMITESLQELIQCLFENYDGTVGSDSICGDIPKIRMAYSLAGYVVFCGTGQAVFLSLFLLYDTTGFDGLIIKIKSLLNNSFNKVAITYEVEMIPDSDIIKDEPIP